MMKNQTHIQKIAQLIKESDSEVAARMRDRGLKQREDGRWVKDESIAQQTAGNKKIDNDMQDRVGYIRESSGKWSIDPKVEQALSQKTISQESLIADARELVNGPVSTSQYNSVLSKYNDVRSRTLSWNVDMLSTDPSVAADIIIKQKTFLAALYLKAKQGQDVSKKKGDTQMSRIWGKQLNNVKHRLAEVGGVNPKVIAPPLSKPTKRSSGLKSVFAPDNQESMKPKIPTFGEQIAQLRGSTKQEN